MCLWFACFGLHKHDDDCCAPPSTGGVTKPLYDRPAQAPHGNGYQYGHPQQGAHYGNGVHRAAPHQTTAAAGAEAGRKASNDARTHAAAATGALKQQPAWNGKADHHYYYEREPVHLEAAAMDHHYSTATATADHERC